MKRRAGGPPVYGAPALEARDRSESSAAVRAVRVESAAVVEVHLCARPDAGSAGFDGQARSMYEHFASEMRSQGASPHDVVAEKIFLSEVGAQAPALAAIRREFYGGVERGGLLPAVTCVQLPPSRPGQLCEVQALVLCAADGTALSSSNPEGLPDGATCRVVETDGLRHVFLANVIGGSRGDGLDFSSQASSTFRNAEAALARQGFSFRDVARTWIYVADIRRNYAALNRARRRFLSERGILPPPASTGIGGIPHPADRACGLDLRAIAGKGRRRVVPFGAPTMNEAPSYGSDFSRGIRVDLEGRSILYVSGTASIDAAGRIVHPGDVEGQADRTLRNIEALLSGQGAGYADVVSAVTYLKRPEYLEVFRSVAARRGFPARIPNTLCLADICRPDWLCEMEATAVLV
jgi:enamine deaminase RidA (YjgF/YER057c/UK114 family)